MLDSLLRLLDRLASSRDAWRVAIAIALTAVVVVPAAPTVSRVAELTGVDPGWLYVITGVFFYAVSILLVNGILSGSRALQKGGPGTKPQSSSGAKWSRKLKQCKVGSISSFRT